MAIDISKYNDTFKAFVDFASAAECPWGLTPWTLRQT